MGRRGPGWAPLLAGAVALLAAACGGGGGLGYGSDDAAASGGDGMTLTIVTPAQEAQVSQPFTLKVAASVPLGEPETAGTT